MTIHLTVSKYWYDLRTRAVYTRGEHYKLGVSNESILAFQRGGTIIPRKDRFHCSSTQMIGDPYTPLCFTYLYYNLFVTCYLF